MSAADSERIVDEQSLWNYELGVRHAFAGGRGLFAANGYYIDWDNQVVQITVPCTTPACPTPSVIANANAGKTRIWGVELEGSFEPIENLTARATYSYINAEYVDFISRIPLSYGGNQQVGGNKLQNTPKQTASAALIYSSKLNSSSGLGLFGSVVYSYRSKQFLDEINRASIGSTHLLRAQVGLEGGGFRISAFGENLLNSNTPAFATRFNDFSRQGRPSYLVALREPRYFGVRLDFNY
jgi:outer membrane receptor protein involved in Fe transport